MSTLAPRTLPASATRSTAARPTAARSAQALAWLSLLLTLLVGAGLFGDWIAPLHWARRHPVLFHQLSGYLMLGLIVLGMAFGLLRRAERLRLGHAGWLALHQGLGLALLTLLVLHAAGRPAGFLQVLLGLLLGLSLLGAARLLLDTRRRPRLAQLLLALHTTGACVASALVLGHLVFVYAYTR